MPKTSSIPDPYDAHLCATMPAYVVVGTYLTNLLKEEIRANTTPKVFNQHETTQSIVSTFRRQFAGYTNQQPPFMYGVDREPRTYWKKLVMNEDASVLAVSTIYCHK